MVISAACHKRYLSNTASDFSGTLVPLSFQQLFFFRYLGTVKSELQGLCQVQHAPFAKASGAVDSRYGLKCLSMMLRTTALEPTSYDAIVFNFGMHDIDYSKLFPEVSTGMIVFYFL